MSIGFPPHIFGGASIRGLGFLPGDGFSVAYRISSDGSTVVGTGALSRSSLPKATRWTETAGLVPLGDLPGGNRDSYAFGVSADGSVIVGGAFDQTGASYSALYWSASTGTIDPVPAGNPSEGRAVSADGITVAGTAAGNPYRWVGHAPGAPLGNLPGGAGLGGGAIAVTDDGSAIVGWSLSTEGHQAFKWTAAGGMIGLGDLPTGDFKSDALDISANGSVVVGRATIGSATHSFDQAFRWTEADGMVSLGNLVGAPQKSQAFGVSADGETVVGFCGSGDYVTTDVAFIWRSDTGMQSLASVLASDGADLSGWSGLSEAWDISADGTRIVGLGYHNGLPEAFLAVVPEPAVLSPLAFLAAAGIARRRSRSRDSNALPIRSRRA
jgi:probable HAF family extracellular repeat protein